MLLWSHRSYDVNKFHMFCTTRKITNENIRIPIVSIVGKRFENTVFVEYMEILWYSNSKRGRVIWESHTCVGISGGTGRHGINWRGSWGPPGAYPIHLRDEVPGGVCPYRLKSMTNRAFGKERSESVPSSHWRQQIFNVVGVWLCRLVPLVPSPWTCKML
jgi:hypothetical protein